MNSESTRLKLLLLSPFLLTLGMFSYDARADEGLKTAEAAEMDASFITTLAESGKAPAQSILGEMHLSGNGVPRDYAEALKWFRAAAEQGDAEALRKLGFMYETGLGVQRDLAQALIWYDRAAQCGDLLSSYRFGFNYAGSNVP